MDGSKVGFTLSAPIDAFASKVSTIAHAHLEKVLREVLRVRCVKSKVQTIVGWPTVQFEALIYSSYDCGRVKEKDSTAGEPRLQVRRIIYCSATEVAVYET